MKMAILKETGKPVSGLGGIFAAETSFGKKLSTVGHYAKDVSIVDVDISNMSGVEDYVVVSKSYLEEVEEDSNKLSCLEAAGVDNWSGYDYACELMGDVE
ncbi:hypothetical protein P4159_05990 [Bacillus thuringiensis]|uniref:hypothetical protein n=1 Tax=Bacillus cereus group TaxID=86661 RepID=UPI000CD96D95|nr:MULTISPECIES: hypothetical protein [Bacillus cereus group]MEC3420531.1 hypothetical protein [Bacillus cereus]MEC3596941.1 hypothetical protein [Bacillus thuringiensis]MED1574290.1 hypothetical protein [Bacillus paranthracis]MED1836214.1 hypothetical protein [Bacillus thuringiensis]MED2670277.1 hypothetical protein [Bacillus thuringiensis]